MSFIDNFQIHKDKNITSVIDLFKKTVQKNPHQRALFYEGKILTYQELDMITTNIANLLKAKNVSSNDIVAIIMDSSIEMIISILSILKAQAAYLPINSLYPTERIIDILNDSNPSCIICKENANDSDILHDFPNNYLFLNNFQDFLYVPQVEIENQSSIDDLCYVIYTSGSTGKPKGVKITHQNLINLILGLYKDIYINYGENLNVALIAPTVFDASVQQIFGALLQGHQLFIVPNEIKTEGNSLVEYFNMNSIDISDGTPSHLRLLLNSEVNHINLEHLIIGGEVLPTDIINKFYEKFKFCQVKITNIYGITECCVDSTSYLIEADKIPSSETIPIGKPLINTFIYILDEQKQPVPDGETGEIYISGLGIGSGYINDKNLTKEKFIENPFLKGFTLYKTNDLGRRLPDGNIEFLSRKDNQVKIRGYRIELNDIKHHILSFYGEKNNHTEYKKCPTCFLNSAYPDLIFNDDGICSHCTDYEKYKDHANKYFKPTNELISLIDRANIENTSQFDCLLLYSGGKDSTYVLYRLLELGYKVLTFTFDNGYISKTAFKNIERITKKFNVQNITLSLDNMDQVFFEDLKLNSTVCNGCFRALTYLSTHLAYKEKINVIITGLNRGQIFDTKLYGIFKQGIYEDYKIEEKLNLYRRLYHTINDKIADLIGLNFNSDKYFDNVHFIDYFRYDDTPEEEVKQYLSVTDKYWSQPQDTGFCSTNCSINNTGIYVHIKEKGFHNYAAPLSWDYRMGLINYADGLNELNDTLNKEQIQEILTKLEYKSNSFMIDDVLLTIKTYDHENYLCAYLVKNSHFDNENHSEHIKTLKSFLKKVLPVYMIPSYFMIIKTIPLTINGKIDYKSLPNPINELQSNKSMKQESYSIEEDLIKIWKNTVQSDIPISSDNLFNIGLDSFKANILINEIINIFNVNINLVDLYENPTIKQLATLINRMVKHTENKPANVSINEVSQTNKWESFQTIHEIYEFKRIDDLNHLDCRKQQLLSYLAAKKLPFELLFFKSLENTNTIYKSILINQNTRWEYESSFLDDDYLEIFDIKNKVFNYDSFNNAIDLIKESILNNKLVFFVGAKGFFEHWKAILERENNLDVQFYTPHSFMICGYEKNTPNDFLIMDDLIEYDPKKYSFETLKNSFENIDNNIIIPELQTINFYEFDKFENNLQEIILKVQKLHSDFILNYYDNFQLYDQIIELLNSQNINTKFLNYIIEAIVILSGSRYFYLSYLLKTECSKTITEYFSDIYTKTKKLIPLLNSKMLKIDYNFSNEILILQALKENEIAALKELKKYYCTTQILKLS